MKAAGPAQDITTSVARELGAGTSEEDILERLRARGLSEHSARRFLERAKQQGSSAKLGTLEALAASPQPAGAESGRGQLVAGAFWFSLGLIVTGASYLFAEPGGKYVLAYGAIVYGAIDLVRGYVQWSAHQRAFPWRWFLFASLAPPAGLLVILIGASVAGYVRTSRAQAADAAQLQREEKAQADRAAQARAEELAAQRAAQDARNLEGALKLLGAPMPTRKPEGWCSAAAMVGRRDPSAARPLLLEQIQQRGGWDANATRVRFCAAAVLATMGETDVVVAFHLANIGSCDPELRWRSFKAMAGLGARGTAAVPAMIEDLSSPKSQVRMTAAQALGDMGPAAAGATAALKAARDDSAAVVRDTAERALEKVDLPGSAGAAPLVAARQSGPDASDEARVAEARKRIESPFSYYEADQWCAAAALLASRDPAWVRPYLVAVVRNRGPRAAEYPTKHFCAAEALVAAGELDIPLEFHMANINGEPAGLRQASLFRVGALGARASAAVPALVSELSKGDLFSTVTAIDTLAQIGPGATAAVPALKARLNDGAAVVREAAARALRKIGAEGT